MTPEATAQAVDHAASQSVGTFAAIVQVLSNGGPWALLVVAGFVIWKLYSAKEQAALSFSKEKQELNDRMLEIAKEQTAVIVSNTENVKKLTQAIRPLLQD